MPTPKKPSLADMNKFADTAIDNKETETKNPETTEPKTEEKQNPIPEPKQTKKAKKTLKKTDNKQQPIETHEDEPKKKKVGRKASRPGCTEKIYFTTTPETKERIQLAILEEKIKETKKGNSLFDQSSFLENAVLDYLKRHKY
jgi:hypothetical protein